MKRFVMLFLLLIVTSCETTSTSGVNYYMLGLKVDPANRPFGYRVYSDGDFKGRFYRSNSEIRLSPGEHTIKVVSEGFESQERQVNIIDNGSVQTLNINLSKGSQGLKSITNYDNTVTLSWNASATNFNNPISYKVYYGQSPGDYTDSIDVGNVTTYTMHNLPFGTWYFAVTAYDDSGNESDYSEVVSKIIE